VKVEVLTDSDYDALAHLAFHELVTTAETKLPILVKDDGSYLVSVIDIKRYLLSLE
jgi:glutaredoxin 2